MHIIPDCTSWNMLVVPTVYHHSNFPSPSQSSIVHFVQCVFARVSRYHLPADHIFKLHPRHQFDRRDRTSLRDPLVPPTVLHLTAVRYAPLSTYPLGIPSFQLEVPAFVWARDECQSIFRMWTRCTVTSCTQTSCFLRDF